MLEKRARRAAKLGNLLEVRTFLLHEFQRVRFEHLERLDMDVAVGDQVGRWSLGLRSWVLGFKVSSLRSCGKVQNEFANA